MALISNGGQAPGGRGPIQSPRSGGDTSGDRYEGLQNLNEVFSSSDAGTANLNYIPLSSQCTAKSKAGIHSGQRPGLYSVAAPLPRMPQKLLSRFDPFRHTFRRCLRCQALRDQYGAVRTFRGATLSLTDDLDEPTSALLRVPTRRGRTLRTSPNPYSTNGTRRQHDN